MVHLAPLLLALPIASAALTCKPFVPKGWKNSHARINWYDNNPNDDPTAGAGFHSPTLPANATAAPTFHLATTPSIGTSFQLKTCNSTTQNLYADTSSSCSHGGCYRAYTDFVQVINPATSHCLTTKSFGVNATALGFVSCLADPADTAQLWSVGQQVLYTPAFGKITGYEPVTFDPVQTSENEGPFLAWILDRKDNLTVELIQFDYTQDGLSAVLIKP